MKWNWIITLCLCLTGFCLAQIPQDYFFGEMASATPSVASAPASANWNIWVNARMSDSNAPAPVVVTADTTYSAYYPWRACDWLSSGEPNYYQCQTGRTSFVLLYDCGAGQSNTLRNFGFRLYSGQAITLLTVDGSMDNIVYDNLISNAPAMNTIWQWVGLSTPVYYRYFKMSALSFQSVFGVLWETSLTSAKIYSPEMTATNVPAPYVGICDGEYSSTYAMWKVFDRNGLTPWVLATAYPHWAMMDFGSNVLINSVEIIPYPNMGMKDCQFQWGDDTNTWTTLVQTNLAASGLQIITTDNTTEHRYWRIYSTNGWNGAEVDMYTINFAGYEQ